MEKFASREDDNIRNSYVATPKSWFRMPIIHAPRRWAILIALTFPTALLGAILYNEGVLGFAVIFVLVGIAGDAKVVKSNTEISITKWQWMVPAIFLNGIVALLYLWRRRHWFEGNVEPD